jgi:hypothetical protein
MDIEKWMRHNTAGKVYDNTNPRRKRQLKLSFRQLPKLVLHGHPVHNFWIMYTIGDGHCLLHSICMQVSKTYAHLSEQLQKRLVPILRRELADRPELESNRLSLLGLSLIQQQNGDNYLNDADGAAICRILVRPNGDIGYNLCTFSTKPNPHVTLSENFDVNIPTLLVYQENSHFEAVQKPSFEPSYVVNNTHLDIQLNRDLEQYFNAYMQVMFPEITPPPSDTVEQNTTMWTRIWNWWKNSDGEPGTSYLGPFHPDLGKKGMKNKKSKKRLMNRKKRSRCKK